MALVIINFLNYKNAFLMLSISCAKNSKPSLVNSMQVKIEENKLVQGINQSNFLFLTAAFCQKSGKGKILRKAFKQVDTDMTEAG